MIISFACNFLEVVAVFDNSDHPLEDVPCEKGGFSCIFHCDFRLAEIFSLYPVDFLQIHFSTFDKVDGIVLDKGKECLSVSQHFPHIFPVKAILLPRQAIQRDILVVSDKQDQQHLHSALRNYRGIVEALNLIDVFFPKRTELLLTNLKEFSLTAFFDVHGTSKFNYKI